LKETVVMLMKEMKCKLLKETVVMLMKEMISKLLKETVREVVERNGMETVERDSK